MLAVGGGVIDTDYGGEIFIIMLNHSDTKYTVSKGDKIAQIIFEKCNIHGRMVEVNDLNTTDRGSDCFGSTGKWCSKMNNSVKWQEND